MLTLKLTIKPKTAFGTPLHSDTLWGHFCCSFAEMEGEEELEKIINHDASMPFLSFSDAFPAGKLPVPLIEPSGIPDDIEYKDQKKIKKKTLINSSVMIKKRNNLTFSDLIREIHKEIKSEESQTNNKNQTVYKKSRVRTAINRVSGSSLEGNLFEIDETWYSTDLDIYCLLDTDIITKEKFEMIMEYIGDSGYGKDSSVGLGRFKIESMSPH